MKLLTKRVPMCPTPHSHGDALIRRSQHSVSPRLTHTDDHAQNGMTPVGVRVKVEHGSGRAGTRERSETVARRPWSSGPQNSARVRVEVET
jgi:hypothetical protein